MASETLFEKYGGFASVFPIVNAFYDSVLDSEVVSYMFDDVERFDCFMSTSKPYVYDEL